MEVQDGFIVGVFNYCDSWCEKCAFTSRCRVFADRAEMEARMDRSYTAIVDAPPLPQEVEPPPPRWMQELIAEMNEACANPPSAEEWERIRPRIPPDHVAVTQRAEQYGFSVHEWLNRRDSMPTDDAGDAIAWFQFLISAKTQRALTVWPDEDPGISPSDADGSAKVALIGIERSHAAWLALVEHGVVSASEAAPFIADLVWLGEALERLRPRARAFVRPAFDEPDAVAKLLAGMEDNG
jgi:hypothetical protein